MLRLLCQCVCDERGGKCNDAAEQLRMSQPVAQRSIAAHGQATDYCIFHLFAEREHLARKCQHLTQIAFIQCVAFRVVHIKSVLSGGTQYRDVVFHSQLLNPRAEQPIAVRSRKAVQQHHCFHRAFRLRTLSRRRAFIDFNRYDCRHLCQPVQCI